MKGSFVRLKMQKMRILKSIETENDRVKPCKGIKNVKTNRKTKSNNWCSLINWLLFLQTGVQVFIPTIDN